MTILLSTLNARYAHASLGLRYLLANMGPLQEQTLLREFLADARRHGLGCVRIIHGKGRAAAELDASGAPILKNMVDRVLRQRADVLGFHSALPAQGGTGAVVVLLSKR